MGDPAQCRQLVQEAVAVFSTLDVARNNAGITGELSLPADYSLEGWQHIINVNLNSVFFCLKYGLEVMLKQGRGAIINMSSILGQVGTPTPAGYVTAKHGLIDLTQTAAQGYAAQGIRRRGAGLHRQAAARGVFGRSRASSDKASFVTGAYYPVEGGYLAR
ncbi:SDR family NAD(P)-dependent oxidoreductase [Hymenobacter sp. BRD128]|uniref:SDR family NAD(P)-dependent oxidoreductase n=1 Tax=Hymenobacter sp. BRD128 TaxID=2675878 RepID=UPI0020B8E60D|nr:SDR family oxidoreductase [Hymenobacter sp. BRD128]